MRHGTMYFFQFVDARTGERSPIIPATPEEFVAGIRKHELHVQPAEEDETARRCMVLVLGCDHGEDDSEECLDLARIPLMYSWHFVDFVKNYAK